jgi:glycosyltransferase involved in cell wall biosynthesis
MPAFDSPSRRTENQRWGARLRQKICFITTCMGRLDMLRQIIPGVLAQKDSSLLVVDYSCPDRCGDWIQKHHPSVKLVRVGGQTEFHLSKARNMGFQASSPEDGELICFLDADVQLSPDFSDTIRGMMRDGYFLVPSKDPRNLHLGGLLVVSRKDFAVSSGYDEQFRGYGREASDMRLALYFQGLKFDFIPVGLATHIDHDNESRARFYLNKYLHKSSNAHSRRLRNKIRDWERQTALKAPPELYWLDPLPLWSRVLDVLKGLPRSGVR